MKTLDLAATATALVASGKGILAADESLPTIGKRFAALGITNNEENRRAYRELLFTTPGLGDYISGVILFDETIRQSSIVGLSFVEILRQQNIIPGIKVDAGTKPLPGSPEEKITHGLDGLPERLAAYAQLGARFTKWRAVLAIGPDRPSRACLEANAEALARFAVLSQEAGLVPVVEPEVLMDGPHTIERHFEVTRETLETVFAALDRQGVRFPGMLLKSGMVLSGSTCPGQADLSQVVELTLRGLKQTVPSSVAGIVFLSGGQSDLQATERLNALNLPGGTPWPLSFSYGRALQSAALNTWRGKPENVESARQALLRRARCNAAARNGTYVPDLEKPAGKA